MLRLLPALLALLFTTAACVPRGFPPDAVLLGQLFDARSGEVVWDGVVVVADGRIRCAGRAGECRWPADTPVHDFQEAMLLPGLIDLHVHARPHYIRAFVPSGVTTVRDANITPAMVTTLNAAPGTPEQACPGFHDLG